MDMNQKEKAEYKTNERDLKLEADSVSEPITPIKIVVPIFIIAMILMVLFVYTYVQRKSIVRNAEYVTNQMSEYMASNIANEIGYAESSIKLSAVTIAQTMTSENLENPAEIILPMVENTPFGGIEYIRADGMNIMNIGEPFDASDRIYYIEGIKGNTGIWNNYHPKTSKETLMNFYTPLIYDGKIAGVLTGYIEATKQIAPLFETKLYGKEIYGLLVDEDNMVICSTIESEYVKDLTLEMFMEQLNATEDQKQRMCAILDELSDSSVSFKDPNGEGRICATQIPGTQWKVVIIVPAASFNEIISENTRNSIIAIVIISLILISYATFVLLKNIKRRKEIALENARLEADNRIFIDENHTQMVLLKNAVDEKNEYYSALRAMQDIFYSMHVIDLVEDTAIEYNAKDKVKSIVNHTHGAAEMMIQVMTAVTADEYKQEALEFTDLTTLADRMKNKKILSMHLIGKDVGWFDANFITMEKSESGRPTKVIYTTRVIDEEKKQEEKLIRKSQTDELTGLLNRRAYEEDIYEREDVPEKANFNYISLDVNGLKVVNDTKGHAAGDE